MPRGSTPFAESRSEVGLDQLRRGIDRFCLVAKGSNPVDVRLASKPRELPLGEVAVSLLGGGDRGLLSEGSLDDSEGLFVAERVERLHASVAGQQSLRLLD